VEAPLHRVLRSEELPTGTPTRPEIRRVRAGDTDLLLARLHGGQVVAFDTTCPHQATGLEDATEWDGKIRCPRHLYLYDPATGENVLPAREARPGTLWKLKPGYLPVYRVAERDGWVWVSERPEPPPPSYDPAEERRPSRPLEDVTAAAGPAEPVEHPPEVVRVGVGQDFEVALSTPPRPGHFWRVELVDERLAVTSQGFGSDTPPAYRVRLRASSPGKTSMQCVYARPWDVTPAEVRTFVVHVEP
jgi:nitrite reductase/ring-hydroxylating ferredoxin subunit/predicted secreted protein